MKYAFLVASVLSVFLLSISCASATIINLEDYPDFLYSDGVLDVVIVVDDNYNNLPQASSLSSSLGGVDIKVSSELTDSEREGNLILLGTPCSNTELATFASYSKFPYTCDNWPPESFGMITTFNTNHGNAVAIMGIDDDYIHKAYYALYNYDTYLAGISSPTVKVTGDSANPIVTEYTFECVDYDGLNYYTKGFAKGPHVNFPYTNIIDWCSSDNFLFEYVCENGMMVGKVYECPNGCYAGACLQGPEWSCEDSDGYDTYTKGTVTSSQTTVEDVCFDEDYVLEYSCDFSTNMIRTHRLECLEGRCVDGKCTFSCTDSDGGDDIYTQGYTSDNYGYSSDYCDGDTLYESFCDIDNTRQTVQYECPYGCENGVCLTESPSITVISPNGGEKFTVGDTVRIEWSSIGVDYVRIYILDPTIFGSGSFNYIHDGSLSASTGYYDWTIVQRRLPGDDSLPRNYKISIHDLNDTTLYNEHSDQSDDFFEIKPATGTTTTTIYTTTTTSVGTSTTSTSTTTTSTTVPECDGCIYEDSCVSVGFRADGTYCALGGDMVPQKTETEACENSFECTSNYCLDGQCLEEGFFQKLIDWFYMIIASLFGANA